MYYSKLTGGFYHPDIHPEMPSDCVDVSEERYAQLFAVQAEGKVIVAGADGQPVAIDPVIAPPTAEGVRATRDQALASSDWTQLPDVPQATRDAWMPYRQALRDIPEQAGFPTAVEWPKPNMSAPPET